MAGKIEPSHEAKEARVKRENPSFAKLLDILNNSRLEYGRSRETSNQLKQTKSRLQSIREHYLEQLLFSSELCESLHSRTSSSALNCLAAGEIQHCLEVCPDASLLGLTDEHLRAVNPVAGACRSKEAVYTDLEQRLRAKCQRVAEWHAPQKEIGSSALVVAKVGQLPQLLTQQKEEQKRTERELEDLRQDCDQKLITRHKILSEMCGELKEALEQYKVVKTTEANQISLSYYQSQCQAMLGKIEVMHHQLLKGTYSDGRLQALKEIRTHMQSARKKLEERLIQTQQILGHYHNLGDEFSQLVREYREILSEIENKKWALNELGKTRSQ